MSMREYQKAVAAYRARYPEQRSGQAHYNVLATMDGHLADQVLGTKLDPFYQDARVPEFLAWLSKQAFALPTRHPEATP